MTVDHNRAAAPWTLRSGDLVLVHDDLSSVDAILEETEGQLRFQPRRLIDLLGLLESIVVYERVVLGSCSFRSPLAERGDRDEWMQIYSIHAKSPTRDLEERIVNDLMSAGALQMMKVKVPGVTSRELFQSQICSSRALRQDVRMLQRAMGAEYGLAAAWIMFGGALYVAEAARRAGAPYIVPIHLSAHRFCR